MQIGAWIVEIYGKPSWTKLINWIIHLSSSLSAASPRSMSYLTQFVSLIFEPLNQESVTVLQKLISRNGKSNQWLNEPIFVSLIFVSLNQESVIDLQKLNGKSIFWICQIYRQTKAYLAISIKWFTHPIEARVLEGVLVWNTWRPNSKLATMLLYVATREGIQVRCWMAS